MKKKLISLVAAGILCASLALPAAAQGGPSLGAFQSIYEAISAFFGRFGSETSEIMPTAGPFSIPGGVTVDGESPEAAPQTMPGGIAEEENPLEATPYTMPGG